MEKDGKATKKKLSFRSVPARHVIENSNKIAKKLKKFKKYRGGFMSSQNRLEMAEKDRK